MRVTVASFRNSSHCRGAQTWEKEMANQATAVHGVMESGGSYNLHAKIPAGGAILALPFLCAGLRDTRFGAITVWLRGLTLV
jgi:hypothetical protein